MESTLQSIGFWPIFNYSAKQPRAPKGTSKGGQWVSTGAGGASRGEDGVWRDSEGNAFSAAHQEVLSRIGGIPPAWTDVRVNANPQGSPIIRGFDGKRNVRITHPDVAAAGEARKWTRNEAFSSGPAARLANAAYRDTLKGDGTAAAVYLTMKSGMRPGSTADTKAEVQAYGVSTLTGKNVMLVGEDKVRFQFTGKHGVSQGHTITSPALAAYIRKTAPGNEDLVFKTTETKMIKYIKGKAGGEFLTKDLRTWRATTDARRLANSYPKPKNNKELSEAKRSVATKVSSTLGNRPEQALKSYINPSVWSKWEFE